MQRLTSNPIPKIAGEIRLFAKLKNEAFRIPYFLSYHRKLGVRRFFFIDNGSTDGTVELLSKEPDVHLFATDEPLTNHAIWLNQLLNEYGTHHWCVVIDLDELLAVPLSLCGNLHMLRRYLEKRGHNAFKARLLDMYSRSPVSETVLEAGVDPRSVCTYFDRVDPASPLYGGVRNRLFNATPDLRKIPFFYFTEPMVASSGMHELTTCRVSDISGVVLHFKFVSSLGQKVKEAVQLEQYYRSSIEYKRYHQAFDAEPTLVLWNTDSIRLKNNPRALVRYADQKIGRRYILHAMLELITLRGWRE